MTDNYSPEQISAALAEISARDEGAEARARISQSMPPVGISPGYTTLSNDQITASIDALVAAGVSRQEAEAAARADGWTPPAPISAEDRERAEWGLPPTATAPSAYEIELPREMAKDLPFERQSNLKAALSDMISAIGLDSPLGNAVGRHLAEWGPKLKCMTEDQLSASHSQQNRMAVSVLGSAEAVAAAQAKAVKLLEGSALGREVARSSLAKSAWLISSLSIHADHVAAFQARGRK